MLLGVPPASLRDCLPYGHTSINVAMSFHGAKPCVFVKEQLHSSLLIPGINSYVCLLLKSNLLKLQEESSPLGEWRICYEATQGQSRSALFFVVGVLEVGARRGRWVAFSRSFLGDACNSNLCVSFGSSTHHSEETAVLVFLTPAM